MGKMFNVKSKLARVLAITMAVAMALPGAPAWAAPYGTDGAGSSLRFDPGDGPGLEKSSYDSITGEGPTGVFTVTGEPGDALADLNELKDLPSENFGSGSRPQLPSFPVKVWSGYTFGGWYAEDDNKVENLPYAFPYTEVTTYKAVWKGDNESKFPFTVEHYRDFDKDRDAATDSSGWPSGNDDPMLRKFFYQDDSSWSSEQTVNTPVSATYRRDIPGYMLESVLIKNNKSLSFYGKPMDKGGADINEVTRAVYGNMPNDDLTVAYRYKPDPNKKFVLTIKCVDEQNDQIKPPETQLLPVETAYTLKPPVVTSYKPVSAELTDKGDDDLPGTGVVSAETAGFDIKGTSITGNMPNQAITYTYKYQIDSEIATRLTIRRLDEHKNPLRDDETSSVQANTDVPLDVPDEPGYKFTENGIAWDGDLNVAGEGSHFTINTGTKGGTVTLQYTPNYGNHDYWAAVDFYRGQNGDFEGGSGTMYIKKSQGRSLEEITQTLNPHPDDGYSFDGWYEATADGEKTGDKLREGTVINGTTRLYANFIETPGEWFDVTFTSGAHGFIDGDKEIHTRATTWNSLTLPRTHADENYKLAGWYNEMGSRIDDDSEMPIVADQTYTAKFIPISGDDNSCAMPDAKGSIGSEGVGEVYVSGANDNRRYTLTDMQGIVIKTKTGAELKNGCFTGLNPCAGYYVYEVAMSANPAEGEHIHVDSDDCSEPTRVTVPALGDNYSVEGDTGKTMKATVNPAAAHTLYAILDTEGNVRKVQGADEEGWVTPDGFPLKAEFGALEANQIYVVVAKQQGEKTQPESKMIMGTEIPVTGGTENEQDYTVELKNGGIIAKITRDGADVSLENNTKAIVKAGDRISLDTDGTVGRPFKQWEFLIGSLPEDDPWKDYTYIAPTFTMPERNLVLQACYESAASPSNASIEYKSNDSGAAPVLTEVKKENLIRCLTDNDDDWQAMRNGMSIRYIIELNRRPAKASESNAAKAVAGEEAKPLRTLTSKLARQVGDNNKDLPDGAAKPPVIRMLYDIGNAVRGGLDYQLWEVDDSEGTMTCAPVSMDPDPNVSGSGFTGLASFDANIGSSYILTYMRAHNVTIKDEKRAKQYVIKVKDNTVLEDADGFSDLDIFNDYTDPLAGIVWEYRGLGRTADAQQEYDMSAPVTRDLKLYVLYRQADDTAWRNALQKLREEIDMARDLKNNASVSAEDKERLGEAINTALEVANRKYPRPSVEELTDAWQVLKDLVDSISSGGDNPTPPTPPDPDGGGGGGGGGASGRSRAFGYTDNSLVTYYTGTDGNWETAGEKNDQWAFVLKTGERIKNQWANVKNTVTQTLYTYHFGAEGIMDTGWYKDPEDWWYYLDSRQGGQQGSRLTGWYFDPRLSKWYYLNPFTGSMLTGWQKIGDDWYYLNPVSRAGRPLGSLYTSVITPDGYPVDENGRWLRQTP